MAKGKPVIDYELCMACGICVQACPFSCLDLEHLVEGALYKKALPKLVAEDKCTGCGICKKTCAVDVIEIE